MRRGLVVLTVLFVAVSAYSQVVVEPDVVTDSIDVFATGYKSNRSPAIASVATLILPGLGHQYLGNTNRAMAYYTAEALLLFSLAYCERYSRKLFRDSQSYASLYAHASDGPNADDLYWRNMGNFMDSDEFYTALEHNREFELKDEYFLDGLSWSWDDEFYQNKYNELREDATRFHVAVSFFIGAMVINRVVSFIDVRRRTRYRGVTGHASVEFHPSLSLARRNVGMTLLTRF